jgi:hypothetical protein
MANSTAILMMGFLTGGAKENDGTYVSIDGWVMCAGNGLFLAAYLTQRQWLECSEVYLEIVPLRIARS